MRKLLVVTCAWFLILGLATGTSISGTYAFATAKTNPILRLNPEVLQKKEVEKKARLQFICETQGYSVKREMAGQKKETLPLKMKQ